MRPGPAPDAPPPPDPRDSHAALRGPRLATALAPMVVGLAVGAAIRWADGLPALGPP